ncbi:MAG: hypothetical protein ACRDF0_09255, partial [Candidatus Limnocylindria bacterium]
WRNRTGGAEASIKAERASERPDGAIARIAFGVPYGIFLERSDETIGRAVRRTAPELPARLRERTSQRS